jgi:monoamine oxidase
LADQRWDSSVAYQLSRISTSSWLQHVGATKDLYALADGLRGFFLSDPRDLPLLILVEQLLSGTPGRGGLYRIRGGNDQLTHGLAAILGDTIHLNHAAVDIVQSAKKVLVTARRNNGTEIAFRADYAVLTVPAPVIGSLRFDPPLSPHQRNAVSSLAYGPATKTLLQFKQRFWRGSHRRRAYATDLPIGTVWEANEEQRGRPGILTLLAGGSASQATRNIMVKGGIDRLTSHLTWLGREPRDLQTFKQIRWEQDPFAGGGGYAAFTTSYDPALRQWLTQPHGRCFFAGEHTSVRWQGYMNGALESGLRAALDVVTAAQGLLPNRRR